MKEYTIKLLERELNTLSGLLLAARGFADRPSQEDVNSIIRKLVLAITDSEYQAFIEEDD